MHVIRLPRRHSTGHRHTRRVLVVAGLALAVPAPCWNLGHAPHQGSGAVLLASRVIVSVAVGALFVLGFAADRSGIAEWSIRRAGLDHGLARAGAR